MTTSNAESNRFSKNEDLESLLGRLNSLLETAERSIPVPTEQPHPLVVLVGAPRSGTTLAMQWLGSTKAVEVPTNLLSRFFRAPAIGLMIQKMLTDQQYQYRDEMSVGVTSPSDFRSDLGKTSGILNHNSFFYFWRHFQPELGLRPLSHDQRGDFDVQALSEAVTRITQEAERPFAIKGLLMQYDLDIVYKAVSDVLFVHITRDPIANMKSLLRARISVNQSTRDWWSTQPPGSEIVADASAEVQVATQIKLCNEAVAFQLSRIPKRNTISITYEELCASPKEVFDAIMGKLDVIADRIPQQHAYLGPVNFKPSTAEQLDAQERVRLHGAWDAAADIGLPDWRNV